jgi:hypothetical protein
MVNLSLVLPKGERATPAVRDAYDRRVLKTITSQSVTAAIWRRKMPSHLVRWLATQRPARMLQLGLVVRPKILFDEMSQAADAAGMVDCHERQLFVSDVCELAGEFARIVKSTNVEVRLTLTDEKGLQTEAAKPGLRLVTVYRVEAVRHFRQDRKTTTHDWEVICGATAATLPAGAVVMLKQRSPGPSTKPSFLRVIPSPGESPGSRLFYRLQVAP